MQITPLQPPEVLEEDRARGEAEILRAPAASRPHAAAPRKRHSKAPRLTEEGGEGEGGGGEEGEGEGEGEAEVKKSAHQRILKSPQMRTERRPPT